MNSLAEVMSLAETYERDLPVPPSPHKLPVGDEIAAWIDHTLLKPDATATQVKQLCNEAREHHFATVCVNPVYVSLAKGLLTGSMVGVCSVVAFPLGASLPEEKAFETRRAIEQGAAEVDMVINLGALKGDVHGLVLNDVLFVTQEAHEHGAKVKVIIEAGLLNRREKILACLLAKAAGGDYVKTSTGFGPGGATVEDVELMRRVVGPGMGVKAAGGIRSYKDALAMIKAGADRLGSSAGVAIINEAKAQEST